MTNAANINEAADLMAEFNPDAARVFRAQPFARAAMAAAFRAGFRKHSAYSALVCDLIDSTVKLDALRLADGVEAQPDAFELFMQRTAAASQIATWERPT